MPRTRAIRITVIAVCAGGIIGMIVTSATNHNGAAVTFGLVTAVAVLCQMTATTVFNEVTGAPGAPVTSHGAAPPPPDGDAEEVERRIAALVDGGADEQAVRDLVRQAVRLGRRIATAAPPDS
jgi:type IV secretory pathway TrbL component